VSDVAATWTVSDPASFGYNALIFNNYALFLSPVALPVTYADWTDDLLSDQASGIPDPAADPDRDGLANLMEYRALQDPLIPGASSPRIFINPDGDECLEFLLNSHASDLGYQLVGGSNLSTSASWLPVSFDIIGQVMEGDLWRVTLRPVQTAEARRFFRLKFNLSAFGQ
jgi:hypothetical protein